VWSVQRTLNTTNFPCQMWLNLYVGASSPWSKMNSYRTVLLVLQLFGCIQGASVFENIFNKIAGNTCGRPDIKNVMQNISVKPGDSASFQCTIDMTCVVSYIQWYHELNNGTMRLLRTARTHGTPYQIKLRDVSEDDEGFYTCIAGNIMGETASSAYLQVNSGPSSSPISSILLKLIILILNTVIK